MREPILKDEPTFNNLRNELNSLDISQLVQLVGKKARKIQKDRLKRILLLAPHLPRKHPIFERLRRETRFSKLLNRDVTFWEYVAGQDYNAELIRVRNLILKD